MLWADKYRVPVRVRPLPGASVADWPAPLRLWQCLRIVPWQLQWTVSLLFRFYMSVMVFQIVCLLAKFLCSSWTEPDVNIRKKVLLERMLLKCPYWQIQTNLALFIGYVDPFSLQSSLCAPCHCPAGSDMSLSSSVVWKPTAHRYISTKVLLAEGGETPFTEHCHNYEGSYRVKEALGLPDSLSFYGSDLEEWNSTDLYNLYRCIHLNCV